MKRDMDIVRFALQRLEEDKPLEPSEYPIKLVLEHLVIMKDAGFIEADFITDQDGNVASAMVHRITWLGHDFLSASRDSKIWKLAKEKVLSPGASWTFSMLAEFLKQEARRHLPGVFPPTHESN
jgi:hypothetical protein